VRVRTTAVAPSDPQPCNSLPALPRRRRGRARHEGWVRLVSEPCLAWCRLACWRLQLMPKIPPRGPAQVDLYPTSPTWLPQIGSFVVSRPKATSRHQACPHQPRLSDTLLLLVQLSHR